VSSKDHLSKILEEIITPLSYINLSSFERLCHTIGPNVLGCKDYAPDYWDKYIGVQRVVSDPHKKPLIPLQKK
jgi:hypothetical protein